MQISMPSLRRTDVARGSRREEIGACAAPRSLLGDRPSQLTLDFRCVTPPQVHGAEWGFSRADRGLPLAAFTIELFARPGPSEYQ